MAISFEYTVDDAVAFTRHYLAHSPTIRQKRRANLGCWILIITVVALLLAANDIAREGAVSFKAVVPATVAMIFSTLTLLLLSYYSRNRPLRLAKRMYGEGSGRGIFGPRVVDIDNDGIIERNFYNESKYYWRGIDRVDETLEHVMIYTSSMTAIVIPRRRVNTNDLNELILRVREERAKAPPSAPPILGSS